MIETTITETWYKKDDNGDNVIDYVKTIEKSQEQINTEATQFLSDTDWKITRHKEQQDLGIETSLTEEEYQSLLQERQSVRNLVVKIVEAIVEPTVDEVM